MKRSKQTDTIKRSKYTTRNEYLYIHFLEIKEYQQRNKNKKTQEEELWTQKIHPMSSGYLLNVIVSCLTCNENGPPLNTDLTVIISRCSYSVYRACSRIGQSTQPMHFFVTKRRRDISTIQHNSMITPRHNKYHRQINCYISNDKWIRQTQSNRKCKSFTKWRQMMQKNTNRKNSERTPKLHIKRYYNYCVTKNKQTTNCVTKNKQLNPPPQQQQKTHFPSNTNVHNVGKGSK